MNSSAEARLLADLARVPIMTIKVQEVGNTAVVYLMHGDTRIGVYSTMPAAVSVAESWAAMRGLPEPVIEMPCGTHIAASDFYPWYAKKCKAESDADMIANAEDFDAVSEAIDRAYKPRRSVRVGADE